MAVRDIYLKIETISGYSPVEPDDHVTPPIVYRRDCMRNMGHEDGTIPVDEVNARRLTALIYREYLDSHFLVPKPDKLIAADINEPAYTRRVPGTVIYAQPGDVLHIHVKNADITPHSFHLHGLRYGIDSDGSWPFGTQSTDGRRSDEICPGQTWTYTYEATEQSVGAWPFHDHCRNIGAFIDRGLFGGLVVLPEKECEDLPKFPVPDGFYERLLKTVDEVVKAHHHEMHHTPHEQAPKCGSAHRPAAPMRSHGPVARRCGPIRRRDEPHAGAHSGVAGPSGDDHDRSDADADAWLGGMSGMGHGMDLPDVPEPLISYIVTLDELAHAPQPLPHHEHTLHVPIFFHVMSGMRGTPVFQSAPLNPGYDRTRHRSSRSRPPTTTSAASTGRR